MTAMVESDGSLTAENLISFGNGEIGMFLLSCGFYFHNQSNVETIACRLKAVICYFCLPFPFFLLFIFVLF